MLIIIDDYKSFSDMVSSRYPYARGTVVVVGNFDGFHRGHMALWKCARQLLVKNPSFLLVALTFNPHPRVFFGTLSATDLGLTEPQKQRVLNELGVDIHVQQKFDRELAELSGQRFMTEVLVESLQARHVVVGDGFCFAKDRSWSSHQLKLALREHGVTCHVQPHQRLSDGEVISSSLLRTLGKKGDMLGLRECLGRIPSLEGFCVAGRNMGQRVLYPTANIDLGRGVPFKEGVYFAIVAMTDPPELQTAFLAYELGPKDIFRAVVNLGCAPSVTADSAELDSAEDLVRRKLPWLEVHLLNWTQPPDHESFKGQHFRVWLLNYMRPEQSFGQLGELKQQIAQDIQAALRWFAQYDLINNIRGMDS